MAKAKKKRLPKDFEDLLEKGDLAELQAVFASCELNALGGYAKQSALAFDLCPDALARWLVEQGADLAVRDTWGRTPLHARAFSRQGQIEILLELGADIHALNTEADTPLHAAARGHNARNAKVLLAHGASVDAVNRSGLTPLELALKTCANIDIENMYPLAEALLAHGAPITPRTQQSVTDIGQRFEFHRSGFNPDYLEATSHALAQLYSLFKVAPVPRRQEHDPAKPIVVKSTLWQEQHEELWAMLVPGKGPAATLQGEVVRISGKIHHEILDNGGCNWDADFKAMAAAFYRYVQQGQPLTAPQLEEIAALIPELKHSDGNTYRLAELAVTWILQNPQPIKLQTPGYGR